MSNQIPITFTPNTIEFPEFGKMNAKIQQPKPPKEPKPKNTCIVKDCKSTDLNDKTIVFHCLPSNEEMRQKWLKIINNPNLKQNRSNRVCSKHFTPDSYTFNPTIVAKLTGDTKKFRLKLRKDAFPTIFGELQPVKKVVKKKPITQKEDDMIRQKIREMRAKQLASRTKSCQTPRVGKLRNVGSQTPKSMISSLKMFPYPDMFQTDFDDQNSSDQSERNGNNSNLSVSDEFNEVKMESIDNDDQSLQLNQCSNNVSMERSFLVRESLLMQLFSHCRLCNSICTNTSSTTAGDSVLTINSLCANKHLFVWSSNQSENENTFIKSEPD